MTTLGQLLERTVSPRVLGTMRLLVGGVAVAKAVVLLNWAPRMLAPGALRVPWLPGMPQLGLPLIQLTLVVWLFAAFAFVVGWHFRVAAWLLALSITVLISSDQHFFQNHVYLLLLLVVLLAESMADRALSIAQADKEPPDRVPGWPVTLIQWQVSLVYGFGALAKVNCDYLSGAPMAGAWLNGALGSWLVSLAGATGMITLSVASIVLELWLAFALLSTSRRRSAIVVGMLFHLGLVITFPVRMDLAIFSLLMFTAYVAPGTPGMLTSRNTA